MEVTILHTEGCPNLDRARERVARALHDAGIDGVVTRLELVADVVTALRTGFGGSPSILIDGEDPFTESRGETPEYPACRLYATPKGLDTAPSVAQLREALTRRR